MAGENKPQSGGAGRNSKKGRQRYLPHNKAVKKKGSYPLRPGVQGFFMTCDGGRERQACQEAIDVIDTYLEDLVDGKDANGKPSEKPSKPANKKITFSYSDSDSGSDGEEDGKHEEGKDNVKTEEEENKSDIPKEDNAGNEAEQVENKEDEKSHETKENEVKEPPTKKQCLDKDVPESVPEKVEDKSIDKLIEEEFKELGDKNKKRFFHLDTGCNGVIFVQMKKNDGDPSPKDIVQHMMTSLSVTKKHVSRFILRILPIEVSCYASEEEISKAIVPLVEKYFPTETESPEKFAVLYGARANTGIDRMKIINAVAKAVPEPHKVDLSNPDKGIVVEIIKTVCLIGVIEKYKELAKYNLRQLTSPTL